MQGALELLFVHLRAPRDIAAPRFPIKLVPRLAVAGAAPRRMPAPFGRRLPGLAAALLRLRAAQIVPALLRRIVFRGAGLAERNRDRLPGVFDLSVAARGFELAMLELVHDPLDGVALR